MGDTLYNYLFSEYSSQGHVVPVGGVEGIEPVFFRKLVKELPTVGAILPIVLWPLIRG